MTIQVTGKNVEAGAAYTGYISNRIVTALEKYVGTDISGHIRLEKEKGRFRTDCSIKLQTGLVLEARGDGGDAYQSADAAIERLETRVRRHKRRLKQHHGERVQNGRTGNSSLATDYTVTLEAERETGSNDEGAEGELEHPVIVAETEHGIPEFAVSEAVMQLDLSDRAFLIFRNAAHGGLNVVYRRRDGHIGWIDAEVGNTASGNGASAA
jgi:ribosomal subunit interface protein